MLSIKGKKVTVSLLTALFMVVLIHITAFSAEPGVKVVVDGIEIIFEQEPIIVEGRVMAPVRPIAELLGWNVDINEVGVYLKRNGDIEIIPDKMFYSYFQSNIGLTDDNLKISHRDMVGRFNTYHFKYGHYPTKNNEVCPNEIRCSVLEDEASHQLAVKPVRIGVATDKAAHDIAAALYSEVEWDSESNTVTMTSGPLPYFDGEGLPEEYREWLLRRTYEVYKPHGAIAPWDAPVQSNEEFAAALEAEVLRLVNVIRGDEGLSPLSTEAELSISAQKRADELPVQFSHTRPSGESASSAYNTEMLSYGGENILKATAGKKVETTAAFVVDVWMNSPGHRANILDEDSLYMGLGTYRDGNGLVYCAQGFINK